MSEKEKPLSNDALAGEFDKGSGVSVLSARLHRYATAKTRQTEILNHINGFVKGQHSAALLAGLPAVSTRMGNCGNYLLFHQYFTIDEVKLAKAQFCMKHLLCPLCAIRRGAKQVKAYLEKLELLLVENPNLKPYMLTLTVKNGHDLSERFEHLTGSVRKLLKRRRDAKDGKTTTELLKAAGGVFSYEFTHSDKGWHPHVHMVVLCDPSDPISFCHKNPKLSPLSKEWNLVTGDSFIVDFRPITGDPADGFIEVFKYALKFSDLSPQENLAAFLTLKARRLTGSFGLFWGVQVPENLTDDLYDDLPYIELFYRYTKAGYSLSATREGGPSKGEGTRVGWSVHDGKSPDE